MLLSLLSAQLALVVVLLAYLSYHYRFIRMAVYYVVVTLLTVVLVLYGKMELRLLVLISVLTGLLARYASAIVPAVVYLVEEYKKTLADQPVYFGPRNWVPDDANLVEIPDYHCALYPDECGEIGKPTVTSWFDAFFKQVFGAVGTFWQEFGFLFCIVAGFTASFWYVVWLVRWMRARRHRLRRGYEEILEMVDLAAMTPEKMAVGSTFVSGTNPKFQCEVYVAVDGGNFTYAGQAFRVGDNLWTAWHVVSEADEIKLVNPKIEKSLTLTRKDFNHVDGDVAIAKLGNSMSLLGLKSGKLAGATIDKGAAAFVEITAGNKRSFGLLTPHKAFGFAIYSGSTVAGFSGAPYVVNNTICGMHLGHQSVNLGYDAAYLKMLENSMNEATEDYLLDLTKRYGRKDFEIHNSPYNPDEVRVRYNGKYFLMDRDQAHKIEIAMQDEEADYDYGVVDTQTGYVGRRLQRKMNRAQKKMMDDELYGYNDGYEFETAVVPDQAPDVMYEDQGNGSRAPATSSLAASAGALGRDLAPVIVPSDVMQKQLQIPTLNMPKDLDRLVTNLPAQTHVQPNPALNSTVSDQELNWIKQVVENLVMERKRVSSKKHQMRKNEKKSSMQPSKRIENGASTSQRSTTSTETTGSRNA